MSDDDLEQSRVGERLSELSTRRVIIGVLLMLFMMPIFAADFFDAGETNTLIDGGLKIVHDSAISFQTTQARWIFSSSESILREDTGEKCIDWSSTAPPTNKMGTFPTPSEP